MFDARLLQIDLLNKLNHSQLAIDELVINVSLADFRLFGFVQPFDLFGKLALKILLFLFFLLYAVQHRCCRINLCFGLENIRLFLLNADRFNNGKLIRRGSFSLNIGRCQLGARCFDFLF